MARNLSVTVAVIFFLFALACARTPIELPANDVTASVEEVTVTDLTGSNPKTTNAILLPSEKPELESVPVSEPRTTAVEVETEAEMTDPIKDTKTEAETVPLKVINFRPVNRHFPGRPFLAFRHRRPCGGHRRHQFKGMGPRFGFGNDMIVSENLGSDRAIRGGRDHQMPSKWERFHHHDGHRFQYMHEVVEKEESEEMKRPHQHQHHHRHDHMMGEEREHEHHHRGHHQHHDDGFMMRIRKFLNNF